MYFWVWETSVGAALRVEATASNGRDEGAELELSWAGLGAALGAFGRALEAFCDISSLVEGPPAGV
jgi:hypothetical protein